MKNTYVKCADWSWEDKLLYIKACIGEDMPHEKFCGNASYNKACLLERYSRVAAYIYCYSNGMMSFDVKSDGLNLSSASKREVKLSELKPKPTKFAKVEESIFDLKEEFEKGELYSSNCESHYTQLKYKKSLYLAAHQDSIYRKVEITERDLFIDMIEQAGAELSSDGEWSFACLAASVFDSGHIKLTDKPE